MKKIIHPFKNYFKFYLNSYNMAGSFRILFNFLELSMFKIRTKNNINILFNKFNIIVPKFNLLFCSFVRLETNLLVSFACLIWLSKKLLVDIWKNNKCKTRILLNFWFSGNNFRFKNIQWISFFLFFRNFLAII